MADLYGEIDPPQRLLMGPGPVNAHPRVLRAMSADLLGQFDPEFTTYMNETMALYRRVFQTANRWTFLIDGTARAAIEAALLSLVEPGATVLIVRSGRFGLLLSEIIEPRVEEIFSLVRQEILKSGYDDRIASGVVITGGSTILEGMPELAEQVFNMPVRRGTPRAIGGLVDVVKSPMYATGVGLVIAGSKGVASARFKVRESNIYSKVKGRMKEWFGEIF